MGRGLLVYYVHGKTQTEVAEIIGRRLRVLSTAYTDRGSCPLTIQRQIRLEGFDFGEEGAAAQQSP